MWLMQRLQYSYNIYKTEMGHTGIFVSYTNNVIIFIVTMENC